MIFFDIDGTLLDYEAAERNGIIDFFQIYNTIFSGNELEATRVWHELSEEYFNKFLSRELSFQEQQVEKLTALNILKHFKYIFTSSELGISKPDPEIFHRTVLQSNLEMKDCYYIGDRLETDAISSTAAGMQGIWLNRDNSQLKYDIPTICSLHEVLTII
ncbi:HAD family hydrolase [Bacillus cereus]|uniref:HAD family hydrolase n=1 Tax=Bacillus cereus TaxID=1396 RepID=UPI00345BD870|nr:HAD family hydrolase [Bacillus cereus]